MLDGARFSVVTIVLNDKFGFEATSASIASQNYTNFEWIVIDGMSTDGTLDAIEANSARIAVRVSEKDAGIYDAMNKGLRLASGDFVVFMNAGDEFSESALERVAAEVSRAGGTDNVDMVLCGATLVFPSGDRLYKGPRPPNYVRHSLPANHQSIFTKTEIHQANEFPADYRVCGDYAAVAKIISAGANILVVDVETALRDTVMTSTAVKSRKKLYDECKRVQREILGLAEPEIARSYRKRFVNQELRRTLTQLSSNSITAPFLKIAMSITGMDKNRAASGIAELYPASL